MAPSSRRKPRRILKKKKLLVDQSETEKMSTDSPVKCFDLDNSSMKKIEENSTDAGCTTPKAQRNRIPEIRTCPPAPKKRRLVSSSCTMLRRTPIAFFDPPDIDLFFASHLAAIYQSNFPFIPM